MREALLLASLLAATALAGCASPPQAVPQPSRETGMLLVGSGRFTMGHDEGALNERPEHKVEMNTYAIDRTEVSAGDFAEFLNAAGNDGERYLTPDDHATVVVELAGDGSRQIHYKARPGFERYPANNVSWHGADAYCRWRGKRLPTEAEWEKSARGTDKRLFPWGERRPESGKLAQFEQKWEEKQHQVLVPVDALADGASPYGLFNMAGNVLEWVNDWYRQNLCDFCNPEGEKNTWLISQLAGSDSGGPGDGQPGVVPSGETAELQTGQQRQAPPRNNPAGPKVGSFKVLRGGSWMDIMDVELATTRRFWLDPTQRFPNTGFRCAKDEPGGGPGTPAASAVQPGSAP